jgi:colanic acid/amylovoran biosynthesis glycosyltransferase
MMPVIAYISQQFPNLTMTFTYREVLALQRRGLTISPISTWRPQPDTVSKEAVGLVDETFYIFPLRWPRLLSLHLHYLVTRPGCYLSTLGLLALFNRESFKNRLRLLVQFVYAILAVAEVERCQAQHIHADFALNAATVAMVASRLTGKPFSFTAHAADIFVNPILLREKIKAARYVVTISDYNKRHLVGVVGGNGLADKIHIVHCGLDMDQFVSLRERSPHSRPLLLAVGRLVEKKGLRYLVQACHILKQQGRDFECIIVGQGPEESTLRELIKGYGLIDRVRLLGAVPQESVRELLQRADIFALPCVVGSNGDQDGIPVVLMEAMAMRVPVVSTHLSGISELVKDEVNGLLVSPGDAGALADAVTRLLDYPLLATQMSDKGRSTVEQDFNIERNARQLAVLLGSN